MGCASWESILEDACRYSLSLSLIAARSNSEKVEAVTWRLKWGDHLIRYRYRKLQLRSGFIIHNNKMKGYSSSRTERHILRMATLNAR